MTCRFDEVVKYGAWRIGNFCVACGDSLSLLNIACRVCPECGLVGNNIYEEKSYRLCYTREPKWWNPFDDGEWFIEYSK